MRIKIVDETGSVLLEDSDEEFKFFESLQKPAGVKIADKEYNFVSKVYSVSFVGDGLSRVYYTSLIINVTSNKF